MCPHCKNKLGFVCGMCIECGWNSHSNKFDKIMVYTETMDFLTKEQMIARHSKNTKDKFLFTKPGE